MGEVVIRTQVSLAQLQHLVCTTLHSYPRHNMVYLQNIEKRQTCWVDRQEHEQKLGLRWGGRCEPGSQLATFNNLSQLPAVSLASRLRQKTCTL